MDQRKHSWIDVTLCALGIVGTMGCFLQMYALPINLWMVILLMGATSILLFTINADPIRAKKWMKWMVLGYVLFVLCTFTFWKDGFAFLMNTMFRVYESNSQYTFQRFAVTREVANQPFLLYVSIWILFTPMCAIIIRSIRLQHSFILCFIVTAPFIFSILLFTLIPHPWFFSALLVFYFALAGMGTAGHYRVQVHHHALQKMGLLFGCSGLAFILLFTNLFPEQTYVRSTQVEDFRLAVQVKIREIIEGTRSEEQGELDLATAGNRFYIGSKQLQVEMQYPQTLYLHGYSASDYSDNKWQNMSDNEPLKRAASLNFASLYEKDIKVQTMKLTYLEEPQNYLYTPYALLDEINSQFEVVQDQYVAISEKIEDSYTMRFGFVDDERMRENLIQQNYQRDYYEIIKNENLQVPNRIANSIQRIEIEGIRGAQSEAEKIELIQGYMQSFGSYTLSPGATPEGEDFILYFLEKNKTGYCVHYASAATMLLRYYGIPARYASGFRIDRSSFQDGVAIAQDYQQHAWVEIFDPLFGWTPLEVTPASNYSSGGTTPNQGGGANNTPNNTPNDDNQTTDPTTQEDPTNEGTGNNTFFDNFNLAWIGMLVGTLLIIVSLPIRRSYLVRKHQSYLHQQDHKKAILTCQEYLELLQVHDYPDEIWSIFEEARYSNHPMSKQQRDQVVTYCEKEKTQHKKECSRKTRMYEQYIKGYF